MDTNCIEGLDSLPASVHSCVLTVGNFDGVHVGHQRILTAARVLAETEKTAVVAMTFDPPPDLVLRPADAPQRISPHEKKCGLLLAAGVDTVVTARTTKELLAMPPEDFLKKIILRRFSPSHFVEGRNFAFGRGRTGNIDTLRAAQQKGGMVLHVVEPVSIRLAEGQTCVSSTLIRRLVSAGRIEDANRCLGREFALYGEVIAGQGRGRLLEFPTANIDPAEQVCPAEGVYAGKAALAGREFLAAISIGVKPTFAPAERTVEAFLIDAGDDYYGRLMTLSFVGRLRDQRRFENAETLKKQIAKDVQHVRKICG